MGSTNTKYFVLTHLFFFFFFYHVLPLKFPHPLQPSLSKRNSRLFPTSCLALLFKMPQYVWLSWNESLLPPFPEQTCSLHLFQILQWHSGMFSNRKQDFLRNSLVRHEMWFLKTHPPMHSLIIRFYRKQITGGIFCPGKQQIGHIKPGYAKRQCSSCPTPDLISLQPWKSSLKHW